MSFSNDLTNLYRYKFDLISIIVFSLLPLLAFFYFFRFHKVKLSPRSAVRQHNQKSLEEQAEEISRALDPDGFTDYSKQMARTVKVHTPPAVEKTIKATPVEKESSDTFVASNGQKVTRLKNVLFLDFYFYKHSNPKGRL